MLRNNVNPNTQDNAGWTPLVSVRSVLRYALASLWFWTRARIWLFVCVKHEAVFDDNYEITLELLSAGAIVNVPGYDFTTPLHAATHQNNSQMVRLLLKFGADPTARDISGRCPEYEKRRICFCNIYFHSPLYLSWLSSNRFYATDTEIQSLLKEYSSSTDIIDLARRFQKKAAPRPIVVYLCRDDRVTLTEQSRLETELDIRFSRILELVISINLKPLVRHAYSKASCSNRDLIFFTVKRLLTWL